MVYLSHPSFSILWIATYFFLKLYVIYTATKKAAERAYKELQRNGKQKDSKPCTTGTKLSKNDPAGKKPKNPKKKCEKRDEKAIQQHIQRRQMQETLSKMQDTPNWSANGFRPVAKRICIFSDDDDDNPCCKVSFDVVTVSSMLYKEISQTLCKMQNQPIEHDFLSIYFQLSQSFRVSEFHTGNFLFHNCHMFYHPAKLITCFLFNTSYVLFSSCSSAD